MYIRANDLEGGEFPNIYLSDIDIFKLLDDELRFSTFYLRHRQSPNLSVSPHMRMKVIIPINCTKKQCENLYFKMD